MTEEGFKLPGSSYGELVKIVKGYGTVNKEAVPDDITHVTGLHPTVVSRNNAFLVGINVIQGGKKKLMTEMGRALARALEHDMPDEITKNWREVVRANEFLGKIVAAVRIRKGMDPSTLQSHIAYSAGQPKTPAVMTGAGAVVDILRAADILKEEEGKLVATSEDLVSPMPRATHAEEQVVPGGQVTQVVTPRAVRVSPAGEGIPISIEFQIQVMCPADELEGLAPKLRALMKELSKSQSDDPPDGSE